MLSLVSGLQVCIMFSMIERLFVKSSEALIFIALPQFSESISRGGFELWKNTFQSTKDTVVYRWNIGDFAGIRWKGCFNVCINLHLFSIFKECSSTFRSMTCCFAFIKFRSMKVIGMTKWKLSIQKLVCAMLMSISAPMGRRGGGLRDWSPPPP